MYGIVVWANKRSSKAIVWCEDNGPLALITEEPRLEFQKEFPEVGDLLHMELKDGNSLRTVTQAAVTYRKYDPEIANRLQRAVGHVAESKVVPLKVVGS